MGRSSSFADEERRALDVVIRTVEQRTRWELSVFVGPFGDDGRPFAHTLHAAMVAPDVSVVLAVDPMARRAEIVTGASVRRHLDDVAVTASLASATPLWARGNVAAGISQCLSRLMGASDRARAARARQVLAPA
jgi:hypothetical protein